MHEKYENLSLRITYIQFFNVYKIYDLIIRKNIMLHQ